MTRFERRLAGGVIASWMLLSILTSVIRIGMRLAQHRQVYPAGATFFEWEWLLESLAAAIFAIYVWRQRNAGYRFAKAALVAMLLFLGKEGFDFASWLLVRKLLPSASASVQFMLNAMLSVDITHFFILILGVAPVVLMIDAYQKGIAAEIETAQLEVTLAEVRLRKVRAEVQPEVIRRTLTEIEDLLPEHADLAEERLLNLSDHLRAALLKTTVRSEAEQRQLVEAAG